MAYQFRRKNNKTGITYVYEAVSFWDKEKNQARNKQICIGKLDPQTGDLIPSKRFVSQKEFLSDPTVTASAKVVGPFIVLDTLTERLGLEKLLKSSFPLIYQQILSMAYYLIARGGPLSHCEAWCKNHMHPFREPLASQRITEILKAITVDGKQTFIKHWVNKVLEDDFICYDITSISSYSKLNEFIKFGYNRDKEKLPQLNLAMLFGQKSCLPMYFQRMPGNITDVTTLRNLVKTFKFLEFRSFNFVMDKGFYSKENINSLLSSKNKLTIAIPLNKKWVQEAIDDIHGTIHGPQGYRKLDNEILYTHSRLYRWEKNNRRCYLHLYYNAQQRANAVDEFNEELVTYKSELESGQLIAAHQEAYDTFFVITTTPKRGTKISYNEAAVNQYISRYSGFQVLLSNAIKDPVKALQVYRDKDVVEKCFDDLKNQLDMKRLRMHSSASVDGRLFVQFIALILTSALRRELRETNLIEKYTTRELLQEMDTLTEVKYSGKYGSILTEVTKPQRQILKALGIQLPNQDLVAKPPGN